jgi:hypothetical protein
MAMAPNEEEFLLLPPGMMPAVREKDLKELFKRTPAVFPKTKLSDLIPGQMCYCTFKVSSTVWGYLAVVEKVEGNDICFRVADNREFLASQHTKNRRRQRCLPCPSCAPIGVPATAPPSM